MDRIQGLNEPFYVESGDSRRQVFPYLLLVKGEDHQCPVLGGPFVPTILACEEIQLFTQGPEVMGTAGDDHLGLCAHGPCIVYHLEEV